MGKSESEEGIGMGMYVDENIYTVPLSIDVY